MDIDEEIRRGNMAKNVLENEVYLEAFESVRQAIISAWESAPIRDREGHHELRLMLKSLKDIEGHLKMVMETGKMAQIKTSESTGFWDRAISLVR